VAKPSWGTCETSISIFLKKSEKVRGGGLSLQNRIQINKQGYKPGRGEGVKGQTVIY